MAEIRVEKKSKPVWPWILGLLLLAAIIWIVVDDNDPERATQVSTVEEYEDNAPRDTSRYNNQTTSGAAMAYVTFIEENENNVSIDHEYSHQALTRLSKALNDVAKKNNISLENKQKLDEFKTKADQIMKDPTSLKHADNLSSAFTSAADIMKNIQQEKFPDLKDEVNEVSKAAEKVKPGQMTTNQKDAVKGFFNKSAEAIEAMANSQQVAQN